MLINRGGESISDRYIDYNYANIYPVHHIDQHTHYTLETFGFFPLTLY